MLQERDSSSDTSVNMGPSRTRRRGKRTREAPDKAAGMRRERGGGVGAQILGKNSKMRIRQELWIRSHSMGIRIRVRIQQLLDTDPGIRFGTGTQEGRGMGIQADPDPDPQP